jgi:hypothetical protein
MASGKLLCCHLAGFCLIPFHIARISCLHVQPEAVNHSLALFLVSSGLQHTAYVVRLVLRFKPSPADKFKLWEQGCPPPWWGSIPGRAHYPVLPPVNQSPRGRASMRRSRARSPQALHVASQVCGMSRQALCPCALRRHGISH